MKEGNQAKIQNNCSDRVNKKRYNSYSHQIWVIKLHNDQLYSAFHISKQITAQSQYAYSVCVMCMHVNVLHNT